MIGLSARCACFCSMSPDSFTVVLAQGLDRRTDDEMETGSVYSIQLSLGLGLSLKIVMVYKEKQ